MILDFIEQKSPNTTIVNENAFTNLLRNLASGNIDEKIKELEEEVRDTKTVQQQRIVFGHVMEYMSELVTLRHNSSFIRYQVDAASNFFARLLDKNPVSELNLRLGKAIAKLDSLKTKLLTMFDASNDMMKDEVIKLRNAFNDKIRQAEKIKLAQSSGGKTE